MRILVLSGGLLAAALLQTNSGPAAAGSWCYLNETEHCDQVSFDMCHFGTHGNGGYCYINSSYRWHADAHAQARAFAMVRSSQRPGHGWCDEWGRCGARNVYADHFAFFGYGHSNRGWYGNDWFFGGSYAFYPTPHLRVAHHHRHHRIHRSNEAVASVRVAPAINELLHVSVASGAQEQASNPLDAMALATLPIGEHDARPAVTVPRGSAKGGVPIINFARSCRAASEASVGIAQGANTCLADEISVRDQLARDWDQFAQADRTSCVSLTTIGGGGTYTDLLTCLEIRRDARNLQKENRENRSVLVAGR
jgi:hypothetical protein